MYQNSRPTDSKSGLNFLLQPTSPSAEQPTARMAALSLEHREARLPPLPTAHPLPPLAPLRARSADSGLAQPFAPSMPMREPVYAMGQQRQESTFSDVTTRDLSLSSGPSLMSMPSHGSLPRPLMGALGAGCAGSRRGSFKTEQELRDKREQRRMKNRISAAKSRQRKTDTFETLQRELGEAKDVIQALTLQLDQGMGGKEMIGGGKVVVAVPHDLRTVVGRDYVSADFLMDLLRMYIRRTGG